VDRYYSYERYFCTVSVVNQYHTGLSQKLSAAHRFAQSLPPNDVLLFTDAFDVLFVDSPDHILDAFLALEPPASILFAGYINSTTSFELF